MAPYIFALAACAAILVAASSFPGNAWNIINSPPEDFDLPKLQVGLAFLALFASTASFFVLVLCHGHIQEEYSKFLRASDTPESRRVKTLVTDKQYVEFTPFAIQQPDGSVTKYRIFAKEPMAREQGNILQRDVVLLAGTDEAQFTYSVLLNSYAWKQSSDRLFIGTHDVGIPIADAINFPSIKESVKTAPVVVAIGLASQESGGLNSEDNKKLSAARAENLIIALLNLDFVHSPTQSAYGLAGGQAREAAHPPVDYALQRPAIIVAVQYTTKELDVKMFVEAMNELLSGHGIHLNAYSLEPQKFIPIRGINKGEYIDYKDIKFLKREDDSLIPAISKNNSNQEFIVDQ